jgi:hypothetical protein
MPWYIPILTALIGAFSGWLIRSYHDGQNHRRGEYRKVLDTYLSLTDSQNKSDGFRMASLIRAGALTLSITEFNRLLTDIFKHGRGISEEDPIIKHLSVHGCISLAVERNVDISDEVAFLDSLLGIVAQAADEGQKWRIV